MFLLVFYNYKLVQLFSDEPKSFLFLQFSFLCYILIIIFIHIGVVIDVVNLYEYIFFCIFYFFFC